MPAPTTTTLALALLLPFARATFPIAPHVLASTDAPLTADDTFPVVGLPGYDLETGSAAGLTATVTSLAAGLPLAQLSNAFSTHGVYPPHGAPIGAGDLPAEVTGSGNRVAVTLPVQAAAPYGAWGTFTYTVTDEKSGESAEGLVTVVPPHGILVGSDFAADAEGWGVVGNAGAARAAATHAPGSSGPAMAQYVYGADDYIDSTGAGASSDKSRWYFDAPSKFHGHHGLAYNGTFEFTVAAFAGDFTAASRNTAPLHLVRLEVRGRPSCVAWCVSVFPPPPPNHPPPKVRPVRRQPRRDPRLPRRADGGLLRGRRRERRADVHRPAARAGRVAPGQRQHPRRVGGADAVRDGRGAERAERGAHPRRLHHRPRVGGARQRGPAADGRDVARARVRAAARRGHAHRGQRRQRLHVRPDPGRRHAPGAAVVVDRLRRQAQPGRAAERARRRGPGLRRSAGRRRVPVAGRLPDHPGGRREGVGLRPHRVPRGAKVRGRPCCCRGCCCSPRAHLAPFRYGTRFFVPGRDPEDYAAGVAKTAAAAAAAAGRVLAADGGVGGDDVASRTNERTKAAAEEARRMQGEEGAASAATYG